MQKLKKMINKIEEYAEQIREVNSENIQELFDYYEIDLEKDTEEIIDELREKNIEATTFAIEMIRKYDISLYSPIVYVGIDETVLDLLKSRNCIEFMRNLVNYYKFMTSWADSEVSAASDIIDNIVSENISTKCDHVAVRYQYFCTNFAGHSFVSAVFYSTTAETKEELEKELEEAGIDYDEIITIDELKEKLIEDLKYRSQLVEGTWGTPHTSYVPI